MRWSTCAPRHRCYEAPLHSSLLCSDDRFTADADPHAMSSRLLLVDDDARLSAMVGDYLRERLMGLQERYDAIGDVRGMGLMQALELVKDRKTKEPDPQGVLKVFEETKKRGVLIGKGGLHGNVIRLGPPLIATKDHMDELVSALDAGLATI